jgi:hypothetical protein
LGFAGGSRGERGPISSLGRCCDEVEGPGLMPCSAHDEDDMGGGDAIRDDDDDNDDATDDDGDSRTPATIRPAWMSWGIKGVAR